VCQAVARRDRAFGGGVTLPLAVKFVAGGGVQSAARQRWHGRDRSVVQMDCYRDSPDAAGRIT